MSNVKQILQNALQTGKNCDVTLKLKSGNNFKCHSFILKLNSEYFETLFKEEWHPKENIHSICCSDFDDEYVIGVIKFMYGVPCDLTLENVEFFMKCAVYYGVDELCAHLDSFFMSNLETSNALKLLQIASDNGRKNFEDQVLAFVDTCFADVANDDFCSLSKGLVVSIIQRPSLSVNEEFLFSFIASYVEAHGDNNLFKELSSHFIYTKMCLEFFVRECVARAFLEPTIQSNVLLYLSSFSAPTVDFGYPKDRKVVTDSDIFVRRCCLASDSPSWVSDPMNGDRCQIMSDVDIKLKAIDIFGRSNDSIFFDLSVFTSSTGELHDTISGRLSFHQDETHLPVLLHSPILLKKDRYYTIVLNTKGKKTYFCVDCIRSQIISSKNLKGNVTFRSAESGSSSMSEGQFFGFVFIKN
ncbi:Kelch-like member 25 [Mactra antiquata]